MLKVNKNKFVESKPQFKLYPDSDKAGYFEDPHTKMRVAIHTTSDADSYSVGVEAIPEYMTDYQPVGPGNKGYFSKYAKIVTGYDKAMDYAKSVVDAMDLQESTKESSKTLEDIKADFFKYRDFPTTKFDLIEIGEAEDEEDAISIIRLWEYEKDTQEYNKNSAKESSLGDDLVKQLQSAQASLNDKIHQLENHIAYGSGNISEDTDKLMEISVQITSIAGKMHDNVELL